VPGRGFTIAPEPQDPALRQVSKDLLGRLIQINAPPVTRHHHKHRRSAAEVPAERSQDEIGKCICVAWNIFRLPSFGPRRARWWKHAERRAETTGVGDVPIAPSEICARTTPAGWSDGPLAAA